jgi:hypothetical protein
MSEQGDGPMGYDRGVYEGYGDGDDSPSSSGSSGGGCFPFSAPILTPQGCKMIGSLQVGEVVLSFKNGLLVPRKITKKVVCSPRRVVEVTFETGETLYATRSHTFLTSSGWQRLDKMSPGSCIVLSNGATATIKCMSEIDRAEHVYNIYTAGEHNFVAYGCVAHNFSFLRVLRTHIHIWFFDIGEVNVNLFKT